MRTKDDGKWRICLDYDGTIFAGHTSGVKHIEKPMSPENLCWFSAMLRKWMERGHYVAIITRGSRIELERYLKYIKIDCMEIDNDTLEYELINENILYIYGAETEEEIKLGKEHWAEKKVELVGKFIAATNGNPERMVFADDTELNVEKMAKTYNPDNCIQANDGDYKKTFRDVDDVFDKSKYKEDFFRDLNSNCYDWKKIASRCIGAANSIAAINSIIALNAKRNRATKRKRQSNPNQTKKRRRRAKN